MNSRVELCGNDSYDELVDLWEKSVRGSHHFLQEKDIIFYRSLAFEAFESVSLYVTRNEFGIITAFIGLSDDLIEMLFVCPENQGKGYGKMLMDFAINDMGIVKVDVNEQNEKAYRFYKHLGFECVGRDEFDSTGRPFPILHLELRNRGI